jgi:hypothetical protein
MPMFMGGSPGLYAMAFLLILPYALFRWLLSANPNVVRLSNGV